MRILAIESSCDETAVAIVEDGRRILTDCIASQVALHREYGGVVPEIASRKHIEAIYGLAEQALENTGLTRGELDAVAVTYAPGLIGALLVGVNFAKAAALALDVLLIPVHHIKGHIAANYLAYPDLEPPFLCLVVSGGHTMFVDVEDYTKLRILGGTRDDAAGECFDKVARLLGMPYPGGAALDRAAQGGDPSRYPMPRPHLSGNPLDLSFSGLKTSAVNLIHNAGQKGEHIAMLEARRHVNCYLKQQSGLKAFKNRICALERLEQLYEIVEELKQPHPRCAAAGDFCPRRAPLHAAAVAVR